VPCELAEGSRSDLIERMVSDLGNHVDAQYGIKHLVRERFDTLALMLKHHPGEDAHGRYATRVCVLPLC
jgi:hypothetical protein